MRIFVTSVAALLLSAATMPAALLLSDAFNYPDGAITNVAAGTWLDDGGNGACLVVSNQLQLSSSLNEDVHVVIAGQPYSTSSGAALYASFTIKFTALPTTAGTYFAHFNVSGFRCVVWASTANAASGKFRLGVGNSSTAANNVSGQLTNDLSLNTSYTIVTRYSISNGQATIWLNPNAETNSSVTATDAVTTANISYYAFRQNSGEGTMLLDNLLVGTAFSDVVTNAVQPAPPPSTANTLAMMTYNLHGNGVGDWSTNTAQAQAIGRELIYLNPDIITFNEIPRTNTYQMANWVAAFLPGYYLATNSATDGYIRSGIASRYLILYSVSHLYSSDLAPFGYTNSDFTRDLFEAEISVPNYSKPLHVFVAHLKATTGTNTVQYQDCADKRAAEASAVSNYFVNTYLTSTNATHPYILAGDMNEDIFRPNTEGYTYTTGQPIQRMTNSTGLYHTKPLNPVTGSELTESIQSTLDVRFDYIFPCGLLYSNIVYSQVFRTDALDPVPTNLLANDDITASDHLPVIMYFSNPYVQNIHVSGFAYSNPGVSFSWNSVSGATYQVETSTNLIVWSTLATNLTTTNASYTYATNSSDNQRFFRIRTP